MKPRGQWQGMLTIARFNWPFYLAAFVVLMASAIGLLLLVSPGLKLLCGIIFLGSVYFIFVSLGVSHFIYDRSDLYRWKWLDRALGNVKIRRAIFCHSGFDETSAALREKFGGAQWQLLDHYDGQRMTEPSIRRARAMFPPGPDTLPARHDAWPLAADSADAVFGLLAIHELRSETERTAWFTECKRCLRHDGRAVIVEHVRDTANLLAFGPGFLHFHSVASWQRCWTSAGFRLADQFRVTPFVRVFLLKHP